jgi:hypothetical protein
MPLNRYSTVSETLETVDTQINCTQSEKTRVVDWTACRRTGVVDVVSIKITRNAQQWVNSVDDAKR